MQCLYLRYRQMISKNKIKYIHSLEMKKNRDREGVFVAEGPKCVGDLLEACQAVTVIGTADWISAHRTALTAQGCETIQVEEADLQKASFLKCPQQVVAIFKQKHRELIPGEMADKLILALDGVQDPGNLGTIVRIADWFGIADIVCSRDTADIYNPKVVQSTMGSIARVNVHYTDIVQFIGSMPDTTPVYGTMLEADDMYAQALSGNGIIIMGNEGKGISQDVRRHITHGLRIPSYPAGRPTAESLNVAIATAIVCAEFRRRM